MIPQDSRQLLRPSAGAWHLCYVDGDWAYFSNVAQTGVWGDDWNDAPHDCNAGTPYTRTEGVKFVKVAYDGDLEIVGVMERGEGVGRWGYLSVEDINDGKAPWLVQVLYGRPRGADNLIPLGVQIPAGVSLEEFAQLVGQACGCVYQAVTP